MTVKASRAARTRRVPAENQAAALRSVSFVLLMPTIDHHQTVDPISRRMRYSPAVPERLSNHVPCTDAPLSARS
jgi:hypothetical protein